MKHLLFIDVSLSSQLSQNFVDDLKDHLLAQTLQISYDGDEHNFTNKQSHSLTFKNDRIHGQRALRINYTTYDLRCVYDTISPR